MIILFRVYKVFRVRSQKLFPITKCKHIIEYKKSNWTVSPSEVLSEVSP